jgi:replicative DNA helicase
MELERAVLAVLLHGDHATAIHTLREVLPHPLAFFDRDHRLVYQTCCDLDDLGQRVDAAAVANRMQQFDFQVGVERLRQQQVLQEAGSLDGMDRNRLRSLYRQRKEDETEEYDRSCLAAVGGWAALGELTGAYATAVNLRANAQVLWDHYLKRRMIQRLTGIVDRAYRTTDSFQQMIDGAGQMVLDLARHGESAAVHAMTDVVDETLAAIAERQTNPDAGVKTGITGVDNRLMSLRPGGLYILAARPGVGKTSFALNIVQNICRDLSDDHVLFFSLEVDRVDLVKKLITGIANLDFSKVESGMLSPEETDVLSSAADELRDLHLDLMDISDITVQGLRSVVKRHLLETDDRLKLVVIDYLQLINASDPRQSEYEKVSEITRTLKIMAKELRMPVIALSQMSRESERVTGQPREPRLSDLRGSGSVEQDADAVLFLHRVDTNDDSVTATEGRDVKVVVAKNRFGPTGGVDMKFFPGRQRFTEVAHTEDGPAAPSEPAHVRTSERFEEAPRDDEDLFA